MIPFEMASIHGYPATPTPVIHDGLQARADWEIPTPPLQLSHIPSGSPSAHAYLSCDCYYEPLDSRGCVHARWLCDQRYADLQAFMAHLERCQCRCGRSTWGRTKSFLGSLKKRALSLRSRRKSEGTPELEQGQERGLPTERHPCPSPGELSAVSSPAELQPSHAFIPELAAQPLSTYHPDDSASPAGPAARLDLYSPTPGPSTHQFGYAQAGYHHNLGMPPFPHMAHQPASPVPRCYELDAASSNPNLHAATWYSSPPTAPFTAISPVSPSTISASGSYPPVSPQPSTSSNSSCVFTDASTVTVPGAPLFAEHTTSSPIEYGEDEHDTAPWHRHPPAVQKDMWAPTTTVADPTDNSPGSVLGSARWSRKPVCARASGVEGILPLMESTMPSLSQPFADAQSVQPQELSAVADVQLDLGPGPWQISRMIHMEESPTAVPDVPWPFPKAEPTPLRRPGPRPLISGGRQHSYDSTVSTILDLATPDDAQDTETPESSNQPPNTSVLGFEALPSQQKAAAKKSLFVQRRKPRQEPSCCLDCNFHPAPGPGQRRKMKKHKLTDGHRRNTGQEVAGEKDKFPCCVCKSSFNREDNLWQHLKNVHRLHRERSRKIVTWREYGQLLRATV